MTRSLVVAVAVSTSLATTLALAGCGEPGAAGGAGETHTAPNGDRFNDADLDFTNEMIQRHAQEIRLVVMTDGRDLDPGFDELAENIRATHSLEVEEMVTWLTSWGEPVPQTVLDHANAHGDGSTAADQSLPGMLTADELSAVESSEGTQFQTLWLESMVSLHEATTAVTSAEQDQGVFQPAVRLSGKVERGQRAHLSATEAMLEEFSATPE